MNEPIISTNSLRKLGVDGSVCVSYDDMTFSYRGMTEQANGDMVVHLEYLSGSRRSHDIGVAEVDLDEPYWDL